MCEKKLKNVIVLWPALDNTSKVPEEDLFYERVLDIEGTHKYQKILITIHTHIDKLN